jgi:cytochrome c biogenesis protein
MTIPAPVGTRIEIPGSASSFLVAQFIQDLQGMGPALQVILFEPNHPHENFWVFLNHPEFSERRPGPYQFTIQEIDPRYYSGLQATKDPGVWVVWAGCFLMMAGFSTTFLLSHRRVWVRLTEKGGGTLVEIGAASHRDRTGFEKQFEKISQALRGKNRKRSNKSEESEK